MYNFFYRNRFKLGILKPGPPTVFEIKGPTPISKPSATQHEFVFGICVYMILRFTLAVFTSGVKKNQGLVAAAGFQQ